MPEGPTLHRLAREMAELVGLPQVRLRLAAPDVAWDLIAPSSCELLDAAGRAKLVGSLGPDPLRPTPTRPGRRGR